MSSSVTEPPRPTHSEVIEELGQHVRAMAGPEAVPHPEQIAAVSALLADRHRTLLVARTGFGKSAVYFSATKMLRDRGWGPTVVVSPLLALMRDQVDAAGRLGLEAATINSANIDEWAQIEQRIDADLVDVILIAPERFANAGFRERVFDTLRSRSFALVCDEAHCISDWGHDFRPDYRRLRNLLSELPEWTPVLATTATANQRVTDDVAAQLGDSTVVLRTPLDRESLHLSVVDLPDDGHRLAWLTGALGQLDGSGIIYCLTVEQAESTARWLRGEGHVVAAYTGGVDPQERLRLEIALRANEVKALVATSALGMGFDKGDLAFCIHLGLPPSPVAYYQQIGRAGRALDHAEVIALPRPVEDRAVWNWFESVSLPSEQICRSALDQLDRGRPTSIATLETTVNLGRSRLGTLLNILEVDGAIERVKGGWVRADNNWTYDHELASSLRALRRIESDQMLAWADLETCRMRFLREALDDSGAVDCGRCDRCTEQRWTFELDPIVVARAQSALRSGEIVIEPRKQWPSGLAQPKGRIPADRQLVEGRALARRGDGGWDRIVSELIAAANHDGGADMPNELLDAIATTLKDWPWAERPTWICPMPSRRRATLIRSVALELGRLGKLPVIDALLADSGSDSDDDAAKYQQDQANSAHQLSAVWTRFRLDSEALSAAPPGPVLIVDDETDSRWTLTVASYLLSDTGTPPLALVLRTS